MPARNGYAGFQENFPGGDYTPEEWEFIRAVAQYQERFGRRFPSWREVLHIARCLGYRKVADAVPVDTAPRPSEIGLTAAACVAKAKSEIRNPKFEPKPAADPPAESKSA